MLEIWYVECKELVLTSAGVEKRFVYYFKTEAQARTFAKNVRKDPYYMPEKVVEKIGIATFNNDSSIFPGMLFPYGY